jgi:hypothetical protein
MIMAMAGFTTTTSGNNTIVTFGGNSADQMTLIGYTGTVNSA